MLMVSCVTEGGFQSFLTIHFSLIGLLGTLTAGLGAVDGGSMDGGSGLGFWSVEPCGVDEGPGGVGHATGVGVGASGSAGAWGVGCSSWAASACRTSALVVGGIIGIGSLSASICSFMNGIIFLRWHLFLVCKRLLPSTLTS